MKQIDDESFQEMAIFTEKITLLPQQSVLLISPQPTRMYVVTISLVTVSPIIFCSNDSYMAVTIDIVITILIC